MSSRKLRRRITFEVDGEPVSINLGRYRTLTPEDEAAYRDLAEKVARAARERYARDHPEEQPS